MVVRMRGESDWEGLGMWEEVMARGRSFGEGFLLHPKSGGKVC